MQYGIGGKKCMQNVCPKFSFGNGRRWKDNIKTELKRNRE
jgi:hypothetical protein